MSVKGAEPGVSGPWFLGDPLEDPFLQPEPEKEALEPAKNLERTEKNVLAQVAPVRDDKSQLVVESLFKVSDETRMEKGVIKLRLWLLWGQRTIREGSILAECEYDPASMKTSLGGIFAAYYVTDRHPLNNQSFQARVRRVDTRTLGVEKQQRAIPEKTAGSKLHSLRGSAGSLSPGERLLLRLWVEHGTEVIDPDRTIIIRLGGLWPSGSCQGVQPEEGSLWREVGEITADGVVETTAQYRVFNSWPIGPSGDPDWDFEKPPPGEPCWGVDVEKTSDSRKMFSQRDFKETS